MNDTKKILVVDDSPGDARLIVEYLKRSPIGPHETTHVCRHAEAVAAVENADFDLVILDLGLPDSDGVEGVERMWYAAPTVPIVVLTGSADESLAIDCIAAGADDYVWKGSLDETQLRRAAGCALGRRQRLVERAQCANGERLRAASETTAAAVEGPVTAAEYGDTARAYLTAVAAAETRPIASMVELVGRLGLHGTAGAALRALHRKAVPDHSADADEFLLLMMEALLEFNRQGVDAAAAAIRAAEER